MLQDEHLFPVFEFCRYMLEEPQTNINDMINLSSSS